MVCEKIIEILRQQSPERYACGWDNVGLLVGSAKSRVETIYIALDATEETIKEAGELGADLLLTHHPLIFSGLKKVNADDFTGRRIIELIKNDIACYAMHTNFDVMGMAELAADRIGLKDREVLQTTGMEQEFPVGIGRVGSLSAAMNLKECVELVKKAFGLELVKVFGSLETQVRRGAICPGSGKGVIEDSLSAGAQVLITGDIDHHEGIDAVARGMCVIDAGHYGVEQIFIPYMQQYLRERLRGLKVIAQPPKQPFQYV